MMVRQRYLNDLAVVVMAGIFSGVVPIHITAHPDRVAELMGKFLLGLTTDAPFQ